jgi:hypothetical protein
MTIPPIEGKRIRVQGSEVQGSGFRGSGFRVQRFRVQRFRVVKICSSHKIRTIDSWSLNRRYIKS